MEKSTVEEREGIHVLSVKPRSRLAALRRAKNMLGQLFSATLLSLLKGCLRNSLTRVAA